MICAFKSCDFFYRSRNARIGIFKVGWELCVGVVFPPSLYASDRQYAFLFGKRRRRGSECRGREAWEASRGSTSAVSRLAGRRSTMKRTHLASMLKTLLVVY